VKYKIGEDLSLEEHVDDSEVTLNVSLGKTFVGGDLDFHGIKGTSSCKKQHFQWQHKPGIGVLHIGSYWHSALPISSYVPLFLFVCCVVLCSMVLRHWVVLCSVWCCGVVWFCYVG